jgi:hypothetical protein
MLTLCKKCLGATGHCATCGKTDGVGDCCDDTWIDCDACEGQGEVEDPGYDYCEGNEDAMTDLMFETDTHEIEYDG